MAKHYQAPLSMPWYPRDFETDEVVMFMTLEETGAYIRILNHIMIEGSAPTEPEALAIICRTTPDCIARVWPRISQKFRKSARDSSRVENPKINMIRRLQRDKKRKESEGGKRGAGQKWKDKAKGINSKDGVPHPSADDHPIPTTDDYKEKEKEKLKEKEKENTTDGALDLSDLIGRIQARHPKNAGLDAGIRLLQETITSACNPEAVAADIDAKHEAWCRYWAEEDNRFAHRLDKWIRDAVYLDWPPSKAPRCIAQAAAPITPEEEAERIEQARRGLDDPDPMIRDLARKFLENRGVAA